MEADDVEVNPSKADILITAVSHLKKLQVCTGRNIYLLRCLFVIYNQFIFLQNLWSHMQITEFNVCDCRTT